MENLRNKSSYILDKTKAKEYFERFTKLNVYSYTKDNKIYIGAKPTEVYSLFKGNTSSTKKDTNQNAYVYPDNVVIDQSSLQYYIILALQDFYHNYYKPLEEENMTLKEELTKTQSMLMTYKKKNDERFEILTKNLETIVNVLNINPQAMNIKK